MVLSKYNAALLHGVSFAEDATHVYSGRLQPTINARTSYELHAMSVYAIRLFVAAVGVKQRVEPAASSHCSLPTGVGTDTVARCTQAIAFVSSLVAHHDGTNSTESAISFGMHVDGIVAVSSSRNSLTHESLNTSKIATGILPPISGVNVIILVPLSSSTQTLHVMYSLYCC